MILGVDEIYVSEASADDWAERGRWVGGFRHDPLDLEGSKDFGATEENFRERSVNVVKPKLLLVKRGPRPIATKKPGKLSADRGISSLP